MRQIRETRLALPFSGKLGECAFSSGRYASAQSHSLGQHCSRSCRTNSRSAVILALLVLPLSLSLLGCVGTALKGTSSATPSSNRQAALTSLTCATTSMTGAGTDTCTVTLNAAAGAGGQPVSLSSNTAAVTVPSSVTVAAGATTANFSATISAVSTAQTATLTASSGSGTETYAISLTAEIATLTLQSTSVPFGDVTDGIASLPIGDAHIIRDGAGNGERRIGERHRLRNLRSELPADPESRRVSNTGNRVRSHNARNCGRAR